MYQLTHENHFKFGYDPGTGPEWFRPRRSMEDRYMVAFGRCPQPPRSFRDECLRAARLIYDSTDLPITVLLSGGGDSEVTIRSFHEQGIPVKAAIVQYPDHINLHDTAFAVVYCEQYSIPYRIIDLDLLKFWQHEVHDYAERVQAITPQLCVTMWLADQIDGYPILASGECTFRLKHQDSEWMFIEEEKINAWYRHFIVAGREREACPGFLQYTPELMLAALQHPVITSMVNGRQEFNISPKFEMYQQEFQIIPRHKQTGFEKVWPQDAEVRAVMRQRYPDANATWSTPYRALVDHLCI